VLSVADEEYPWYTLSQPKPRISVSEAAKIVHRYLKIEYYKIGWALFWNKWDEIKFKKHYVRTD
jgi:hypothetical protein